MDTVMYVPAIIHRVIWQSEDGDYGIMAAELNDRSPHFKSTDYPKDWISNGEVIIKSGGLNALGGIVNKPLVFAGKVVLHDKYGQQLQSDYCFSDPPTDVSGMRGYLTSLPHIGEARAGAIVQKFGLKEIEDIFTNDPGRLVAMKIGLNESRMKQAKSQWDKDNAVRVVYLWTSQHGIGSAIADKIVKEWGQDAIRMLEEDPYRLTQFRGVGFATADAIAFRIQKEVPKDRRTKACVNFVIDELMQECGHLGVPWTDLRPMAVGLLSERNTDDTLAYIDLVEDCVLGKQSAFAAVRNPEGIILIYRWSIWEKEQCIARSLSQLGRSKRAYPITDEDINESEKELNEFTPNLKKPIVLDALQRSAIRSAFENPITVLTGGGGVGKSTICRCIAFVARKHRKSIRMMTPTGKAAKVLTLKTSVLASTIHRGLGLTPGEVTGTQLVGEDIVLIDETSMCGLDTMYALMHAIQRGNPQTHLILVGDPKQLPSISPGSFLFDIIASGGANVIKLQQIYRQDEKSYITVVANSIADGKVTKIPVDAIDIKWKEITNTSEVAGVVAGVVKAHLEKGFDPQEIQALAPMYRYDCGVERINSAIQETIATYRGRKDSLVHKFQKFYVGDKVIQLENNYDKDVFNGDVGIVEEIGKRNLKQAPPPRRVGLMQLGDMDDDDLGGTSALRVMSSRNGTPESFVKVNFGDTKAPVYYMASEIEQIRPAWCITIHKFQGSQCRRIIFVLAQEHSIMASRELVYTAITRGAEMVFMFGSTRIFEQAASKSIIHRRFTSLADLIQQNLTGKQTLEVLTQQPSVPFEELDIKDDREI